MAKRKILSIDIGASKAKMLLSGETEPRRTRTGPTFTPTHLVEAVNELTADWQYDVISIGAPTIVTSHGIISEPANLGPGWVGFDFSDAFGKPVKIMNDAAMQALGNYEGGRMLFIGLGTGLGSTLIHDGVIVPMELSNLRWDANTTYGDLLGKQALRQLGVKKWRMVVDEVVITLMKAFLVDYLVVGGGSAKQVKSLPPRARLGNNRTAFQGGFQIWESEPIPIAKQGRLKNV
jgi:polyphosphate glucokinase